MSGAQGDDRLVPYTGAVHPQDTRMDNQSGSSESDRNGHGPIVTFPSEEVAIPVSHSGHGGQPQFFAYVPQFHWHMHAGPTIDVAAREMVERIAHDAFTFGHQSRDRHTQLQTEIGHLQKQAAEVPVQIQNQIQQRLADIPARVEAAMQQSTQQMPKEWKEQLEAEWGRITPSIVKVMQEEISARLRPVQDKVTQLEKQVQSWESRKSDDSELQNRLDKMEKEIQMLNVNMLHQVTAIDDAKEICTQRQRAMYAIEKDLNERIDGVDKHLDTTLELLTPTSLPDIPETFESSWGERHVDDSVTSVPTAVEKTEVVEHTTTTILPVVTRTESPPKIFSAIPRVPPGLDFSLSDYQGLRPLKGKKRPKIPKTEMVMMMTVKMMEMNPVENHHPSGEQKWDDPYMANDDFE